MRPSRADASAIKLTVTSVGGRLLLAGMRVQYTGPGFWFHRPDGPLAFRQFETDTFPIVDMQRQRLFKPCQQLCRDDRVMTIAAELGKAHALLLNMSCAFLSSAAYMALGQGQMLLDYVAVHVNRVRPHRQNTPVF